MSSVINIARAMAKTAVGAIALMAVTTVPVSASTAASESRRERDAELTAARQSTQRPARSPAWQPTDQPSHPTNESGGSRRSPTRRRVERPRPPRRLPPNRVQPGGGLDVSVSACTPDGPPLTALVPVENPVFTRRDRPTFLFYFPDAPEMVKHAEFILLSEDEKEVVFSAQFEPRASGIVSVSLPDTAKALVVGEAYHWYLNMHCETTDSVPSVNGWVQRVAEDEAAVAVSEGMPLAWYDAIARSVPQRGLSGQVMPEHAPEQSVPLSLHEQSASFPSPCSMEWADLLTAAGLDELIDVPVLGPAIIMSPSSFFAS